MKCYTQVYVKGSLEAAELYCRAFGAQVTFAIKNPEGTAYEHCELSVDGEGILALAEAENPCDVDFLHRMKWETMTFNAFELGSEEAVGRAVEALSEGGVVVRPIQAVPWNKCCATVIDRFGVCWGILL